LLSKHLARIFFFYFAEKEQAKEFLHTVRGSVAQIRQISSVSTHRVNVDEDSEDETKELVNLVRRINVENEDPNKKAVENEKPNKKEDVEDAEDEDDEVDPYSSIVESQLWPYDPNAASGIRGL